MMLVQLAGFLGADPEVRFTPSGQKVTSFRLGVKQRKGKEETTVWWRVTIWGETFERMMPYLKKGSAVIVMGEMQSDTYTDREGQTRVNLECTASYISFSPFGRSDKKEGDGNGVGQSMSPSNYGSMAEVGGPTSMGASLREPVGAFLNDEIPF